MTVLPGKPDSAALSDQPEPPQADGAGCDLVLTDGVLSGSVNAGRHHDEQAAAALTAADRSWLRRLITRTVPLSDGTRGLRKSEEDVKVAVDLEQ